MMLELTSATSWIAAMRTPWNLSFSSITMLDVWSSTNSGTRFSMRISASAAFFRTCAFEDPRWQETSDTSTRPISAYKNNSCLVAGHAHCCQVSHRREGQADNILRPVSQWRYNSFDAFSSALHSWCRSFFSEFVTKVSTSVRSSSSNIRARYPMRLCLSKIQALIKLPMRFSGKLGDAISLRHSIWPKWLG